MFGLSKIVDDLKLQHHYRYCVAYCRLVNNLLNYNIPGHIAVVLLDLNADRPRCDGGALYDSDTLLLLLFSIFIIFGLLQADELSKNKERARDDGVNIIYINSIHEGSDSYLTRVILRKLRRPPHIN